MEIMVTDRIQYLHGIDREAVRAAMIKFNFTEELFFSDIYRRLCSLQNKAKEQIED